MLGEALSFLNDVLVQPFAAVLLFRFHAVWLKAPMHNPVGEFLMALTDFVVLRVRRFIRPVWGLDTATLLLAFVVEMIYLNFYHWLQGFYYEAYPLAGFLAWTVVKLVIISVYLLIVSLIVEAILSWVNPHTPLAPMLFAVNRPFLQPLRSRIPPVANVDLTVLILLIICQLVLFPLASLELAAKSLL